MGQLFSKKNREVFSTPLGMNNPVTVQVLGICSALAVTAKLEPAIVMGLSVTVITAFSNVVISLLRKTIPNRIRIIVQLVVVAALVTIVSEVLKAFAYDVSVQLSVYVGLIITNCILMGRLEAFAMQNGPWESCLDGIGNGLGYAKILIIVAFFRELLGSGTLLGFNILNYEWLTNLGYVNNGLMLMPPMALIICACIIWYQRARHKELQELHVVWYDLPEFNGTKTQIMETLKNEGFVVPYYRLCKSWSDYKQFANKHDKTTTIIPSINGTFPIDGLVLTKCDNSGSIAYKFANEIAESTVNNITWQLSRTGRYIPVLNVESVFLSGANISRVTANNFEWLTQWKAGIGSTINIIRSNEIIPTLIGVINESTEYNVPTHCEICGTHLTIHGKDLICNNQNCGAKNHATIRMILNHFKSDGIGNTIIDDIISIHYLNTISDVSEWAHCVELDDLKSNFGSVTSTKIQLLANEICNRKITFSDIFGMANIPSVSSSTTEKLTANVSMEEFISAFENNNRAIIRSNKWMDCFPTYKQPDNIELYFDRLVELYSIFRNQIVESKQQNQPIMMTYALTGALSKTRNEIVKEFAEYGCKFVDVKQADVLVAPGPSSSSKYKLAISRGIKIMTEMEFRELIKL